jgi:predicted HTH domain antitoxin
MLAGMSETAKVTVELPLEVFSALRRSPDEFGRDMRLAAAIQWYGAGDVSMEKAAMIAGLNRRDFLLELARRKVDAFHVDLAVLERELDRA